MLHFIHTMNASNLQGLSNLLTKSSTVAPTNPNWLKNQKDTVHTSQTSLPVVDVSTEDLKSQSSAVAAQSRRIVNQAKSKVSSKTKRPKKKKKKTVRKTVKIKKKTKPTKKLTKKRR